MTELESLDRNTGDPYALDTEMLWTYVAAVSERVRTSTDAWTATYDDGDCSPYQIVRALYVYHQPLHEAIAVLEQAKQYCRQAMQRPLRALNAPVELSGQALVRWTAPIQTTSYAPKTIAAITADLHTDLEPLLPSLSKLHVLLPILSAAEERGTLSLSDTEALVMTINDLARGCRAAQNAVLRLKDARSEGSRAGYVKIEVERLPSPTDMSRT